MSLSPLAIGLVPMTSTDNVEANLAYILKQLEFFESKKTDLICFPENSLFFNFNKNLNKSDALTLEHPAFFVLSAWAAKHNSYLHMGGIPMRDGANVFNAAVLISPDREPKIIYRKIHLFDVEVTGSGSYKESLSVDSGLAPEMIEIKGWKIGLTICYDLRFSELFLHYHKQKADLILVPAAFTVPTGRAHWLTLLKARAIETQSFIAAAGQIGIHKSEKVAGAADKQTWGESVLIEPWGAVLAHSANFDNVTDGEFLASSPLWSELDPTLIQKTRQQIPLLNHRKLNV